MKISTQRTLSSAILSWMVGMSALTVNAQLNVAQINWGSQDFSTIVDSEGNPLDPANFTFALGAFRSDFTPTIANRFEWFDNWITFDLADYVLSYDPDLDLYYGVFASSYLLYQNSPGGIDSTGSNFEDLGISRDAYIWVYNQTNPDPGVEWFLARAGDWDFPTLADECCRNDPPLEWSLSDLTGDDRPLWGNQNGEEGLGEREKFVPNADLQTYNIPEPSTALLVMLAGMVGIMRRSRPSA